MSTASLSPSHRLVAISGRRRRTDRAARALALMATLIALVPLVLIVYYLIAKGAGALSWSFYTTDPTGRFLGDPGGIRSAIVGSLVIVGLATVIAVPIGVGVALWLVEYGRDSRLANIVRYVIDVMSGVPSIVFGLFIYTTLVLAGGSAGGFSGLKGSIALALLMLPVVTRSSEVALNLVPGQLRAAALALGAPRWRVIVRVVLPTAAAGLLTGTLLAIARAAGETAPLLFTAFGVKAMTWNPGEQMNALPLQIFQDVSQAQDRLVTRAWGAALTLVAMVLILNLIARYVQRRSRLA